MGQHAAATLRTHHPQGPAGSSSAAVQSGRQARCRGEPIGGGIRVSSVSPLSWLVNSLHLPSVTPLSPWLVNSLHLPSTTPLSPWLVNSLHLPSATPVSLIASCRTPVSPLYSVPVFSLSPVGLLSFSQSHSVSVSMSLFAWWFLELFCIYFQARFFMFYHFWSEVFFCFTQNWSPPRRSAQEPHPVKHPSILCVKNKKLLSFI